ncbi:DUF4396 domain-containing protein [Pseudooceanicola nanhaiensis]|uniref:DUF4396 domain-containing protein n=1 Tax=Pseudooceanicola nanhaiensis TaxID=375761 RepID=UPI001CD4AA6A|nr:DUF4396 domain-containing protein [Pseudooceanicola nanhaiensis]MCA0919674.1 DUF4396 domain-containing protein [Pseudooceanicola nanhaiensis]
MSDILTPIQAIVSSPWFLGIWLALMLPSLAIVIRDLTTKNAHLMSLMKVVWVLTVLYSGPLGLLIYWRTGRKEIPDDAPWRRAFRSVAHCYSGCGLGEIIGVLIAVGLFSAGNIQTALVTFALAYTIGFALGFGPLLQDGVAPWQAFKDTFRAETPSIMVMEIVAISVDLLLAGNAGMGEVIFWSSLVVSLTLGLVAAYPVNLTLIKAGVKEGMMDPRMTDHSHHKEAEADPMHPRYHPGHA